MADAPGPTEPSRPEWFAAFLADRGTRKPSAHTIKAYCQDFDAIATLIAGGDAGDPLQMSLGDITTNTMRTAFAQYAESHEAATIQRCWSTWNVLCTFLYTSETNTCQPDAVSRAAEVGEDTAEGTPDGFGDGSAGDPALRFGPAAPQRLDRT